MSRSSSGPRFSRYALQTTQTRIPSSSSSSILSSIIPYIPSMPGFLGCCSTVITQPPNKCGFALGILGITGFLGGKEAVLSIFIVHAFFENRQSLGWYNSPGSYYIAREYAYLAKSKFFDGLFLGVNTIHAPLFEPHCWKGPRFRAAHSDVVIEETNRLATLLMKKCATLKGKVVEGRGTHAFSVTIATLNHAPPPQTYPRYVTPYSFVLAIIPISVSFITCLAYAVFDDWYSFASILSGILANGISCFAIGSGDLTFTHPEPTEAAPPGDGILSLEDSEFVLLKGEEGAVNCITRGRFSINFASEAQFKCVGWCTILFVVQFIAQLLLVPHGSPFGQLMFIISLAVSWIYNSWVSSLDKEKIQQEILLDHVLNKPDLSKYILSTRAAMVVFVLLVLQPDEPAELLNELLPNNTNVWKEWKRAIVERLHEKHELEFIKEDAELIGFSEDEGRLLQKLFEDAEVAYHTLYGESD